MNTQLSRVALFVSLFLLCVFPGAFAQDKGPTDAYSGVAIGTGGTVGGKSIQFDFRITQYTTDEEVQNFAQLVKDKGTDALRRALEKEDKGRISPVGSTGNRSLWRANGSKARTRSLRSLRPGTCRSSSSITMDAARIIRLVFCR